MPSLNVAIQHALGQEEAARRVKGLLERVVERYQDQVSNLQHQWIGNAVEFGFSAMGMSTNGTISVGDDSVVVDGKLPLAAMMFRGKIEETIREQLVRVLS